MGKIDIEKIKRYLSSQPVVKAWLSGERKNSLLYGSQKMAVVSATFHTLTATCHAKAISRLKYLKALFHELVKGRIDYHNLIPGVLQIS